MTEKRKLTTKGTSKVFNQEGIRFKVRSRPNSKIQRWDSKDDDYRAHRNFSDMIVRELTRELGEDGYRFKRAKKKGKEMIVCKKDELLAGFFVPTMEKKKYRGFILQLAEMLVRRYNDIGKDDK